MTNPKIPEKPSGIDDILNINENVISEQHVLMKNIKILLKYSEYYQK